MAFKELMVYELQKHKHLHAKSIEFHKNDMPFRWNIVQLGPGPKPKLWTKAER